MVQTQRQLQVGEQIKRAVAESLRDLDFYNLDTRSLSLMEVRMSGDLRQATVYVLVGQGEAEAEKVAALNQLAPVLQKTLAKSVRLKFTPRLKFVVDKTFEEAWKLENLIKSSISES